ncbi:MAG: transglycosylase SLT domain-containing protein [Candidatus Sericytochromatia bacterium]|nr:transglycosylase SLT domain-containing protein [Candidatus Sericytochromatia bacterium]
MGDPVLVALFRFHWLSATVLSLLPFLNAMSSPFPPLAEGRLAYQLGRYERAEFLFGEAASADEGPRTGETQLWLGRAAWRAGHSERALAAWHVALGDPATMHEASQEVQQAREHLLALVNLLERYGQYRTLLSGGQTIARSDWQRLGDSFDSLARLTPASAVGRRAALMAADSAAYADDIQRAVGLFEQARKHYPLLGDWALWRLAALDPGRAPLYLEELLASFPESPLRLDAKVALAEREEDELASREALQSVVNEGGRRPAAERALFLLAKGHGATPAQWLRYWNTYPDGRFLDEAIAELGRHPALSRDTLYRIGSYHFFKNDYSKAIAFFSKVNTPISLYRKGRSHWGLDQLDLAIATLQRVTKVDRSLRGKAWLTIGQIEGQRRRWPAAVKAYHLAAESGGDAGVAAREKLVKVYQEQGKHAAAKRMEKSILARYPWSEEAASITWNEFLAAVRTKRFQDALVHGQRLARHNPQHAYGLAAQYWNGRIYERMGRTQQALAAYRVLIGRSPSSYYGWRAYFREGVLTARGQDPWFSTEPERLVAELPLRFTDLLGPQERVLAGGLGGGALPPEMQQWPESVRELLFLRQFDLIDFQVDASRSPNLRAWLSYLQRRYRKSIAEEKSQPRLAYPLGYAPILVGAARRHGVDPLLMAALVREESRFDPRAKSWVGATGLAQLMPFTADWVVKQVPDVAGRPLTDPHTNLQLGAWYLAFTHRTFARNSMYAVAAYNGGPGAVKRWKEGFTGDPDEFVESIPYHETRLYVKKVFASYWNYVKLYGDP